MVLKGSYYVYERRNRTRQWRKSVKRILIQARADPLAQVSTKQALEEYRRSGEDVSGNTV